MKWRSGCSEQIGHDTSTRSSAREFKLENSLSGVLNAVFFDKFRPIERIPKLNPSLVLPVTAISWLNMLKVSCIRQLWPPAQHSTALPAQHSTARHSTTCTAQHSTALPAQQSVGLAVSLDAIKAAHLKVSLNEQGTAYSSHSWTSDSSSAVHESLSVFVLCTLKFIYLYDISHWPLSWARWIHSILSHHISLTSIYYIFPSTPIFSEWPLSFSCPDQTPAYVPPFPYTCHMHRPSYSTLIERPNNIYWGGHSFSSLECSSWSSL